MVMDSFKLRISLRPKKPKSVSPKKILKEPIKPKLKLTNAQRLKIYRDKIKACPEKFKLFRMKANISQKLRRAQRDLKTIERDNETAKLRMKLYRARIKEKNAQLNLKPQLDSLHQLTKKAITRNEERERKLAEVKQREKWRMEKRAQRAAWSAQKKRREREKRKQRYRKSQAKKRNAGCVTPIKNVVNGQPYITNSAKRKAVYRAKLALPKSPIKYGTVLVDLIQRVTPRKREILNSIGVSTKSTCQKQLMYARVFEGIKAEIYKLKKARGNKDLLQKKYLLKTACILKKYRTLRQGSRDLGVRYKSMLNYAKLNINALRKRRSDALKTSIVTKVINFYERIDISTELPTRKTVNMKEKKQKKILNRSLEHVFLDFAGEYPDIKIGKSKFYSLRPKHILTQKHNAMIGCLCEYCTNVELKITCLKKFLHSKNIVSDIRDKNDAVNFTLCVKEGSSKFHEIKCIKRKCLKCGTNSLDEKLKPLKLFEKNLVTWDIWENCSILSNKNGMQKTTTKKTLVTKTAPLSKLIFELKSELQILAEHMFNAKWQYLQFINIKKNLPDEYILMVLDFAENFTCHYQNEIQSVYWSHEMVTLHPIVSFYRCPFTECSEIVQHSIVFITDDLVHDSHAVYCFLNTANEFLKSIVGSITKEIQWTDGSTGQYKSITPFTDISYAEDDYGFKVERNFFGSRHGKGPCDGLGGVVKRMAAQAVANKTTIIKNAKDMFSFCTEKLTIPKQQATEAETSQCNEKTCCHTRRTFFFTDRNTIIRDRSERMRKTVVGTRLLHAVKTIKAEVIGTRQLSCYCESCMVGINVCKNTLYTSPWKEVTLNLVFREETAMANEPNEDIVKTITATDCEMELMYTDICIDNYVAVQWGRPKAVWVAKVEDIDLERSQVLLKFMKSDGQAFFWPEPDDLSWEPLQDILRNMSAPTLDERKSSNRRQYFVFSEQLPVV